MSTDMFSNDLTKADSFGTPRADSQPTVRPQFTAKDRLVFDANNDLFAKCAAGFGVSEGEAREHAVAIAKALNSHDALVAALRRAIAVIEARKDGETYLGVVAHELRAALALAGG